MTFIRKLRRFFENLLFPPRCISCRAFLQKNLLDACESPFCPTCRIRWEREKNEACPDCGFESVACRCCPPRLRKVGVEEILHLVNYSADQMTVGRRTVLNMKKKANQQAISFMAEQLSYSVKRCMELHGLSEAQIGFCHVPRSRANVARYGFDQTQLLCRALAKRLGASSYSLCFRRRGKDTEQKKLSAKERAINLAGAFAVCEVPADKLVILVDDVVTTGASASVAASLLRAAGAKRLITLCVAVTEKKTGNA